MRDLELTAAGILHKSMWWHLAVGLGLALLVGAGAEYAATGPEAAIRYIRSMLAWMGLALLSGRLLGWAMAWLIPVASIFPLVYYGDRQWWDWTTSPAYAFATWFASLGCLLVGVVAFEATPWLRQAIRRRS